MACLRCLLGSQTGAALSLDEFFDQLDGDQPCPEHGETEASVASVPVDQQPLLIAAALRRLQQAASAVRRANSRVQKREREIADLRQASSQQEARMANLEHVHQASVKELEQQLALVRTQAEEIRELSAPLIEVGQGLLTVPLIGRLDAQRTAYITESLLTTVQTRRARRVILDLTGLRSMDAHTARSIIRIQKAMVFIGAQVTLCGISASVAQELVSIGEDLSTLHIAPTLRLAIQMNKAT